jgi:hypothetical protein
MAYGDKTYKRQGKDHPNKKWVRAVVAEWDLILRNGGTRKAIKQQYGVHDSTLSEKLTAYRRGTL